MKLSCQKQALTDCLSRVMRAVSSKASAIAALGADGPVSVTDAQAVSKSYPGFFTDFAKLGGKADVR